jgi:hypothetical protein
VSHSAIAGAALLAAIVARPAVAQSATPPAAHDDLPVDSASLLLWKEAVDLVDAHEKELWPGYRLGEIPALVTHPKVGEVLIRHPFPPAGFQRVTGATVLGEEPLWVRRGTTVFTVPQETSTDLGGARTLVVSDRKVFETPDDAWCLGTVVHEGFHAFAARSLKLAPSNEIDLADFPDLDPEVNARLELEGRALEAAVRATLADEREEEALAFLAQRTRRRARMPANAVAWEDGNELNEGLATYAEWRAHEWWAASGVSEPLRAALPKLADRKSFAQFGEQALLKLRNLARGTFTVNGSTFGPAAIRYRGYDFGAALARLLDALGDDWKPRVAAGETLTQRLRAALGEPSDSELAERAAAVEQEGDLAGLLERKRESAKQAAGERAARVDAVLKGDGRGTLLVIDVASLAPKGRLLPSSYTPFGLLRVDDHRLLFSMAPTSFDLGGRRIVTPAEPGVVVDESARTLTTRTSKSLEAALADPWVDGGPSFDGGAAASGAASDSPSWKCARDPALAGAVRVTIAR